jgi:hypothetical protein
MSEEEKREGLLLLGREMLAYIARPEIDPHDARREYLRRLEDLRKAWSDREVERLREKRARKA